jgi:hypothetical protein
MNSINFYFGADKKTLRSFGITFGLICGGLFGLILPLLIKKPIPMWPWIICFSAVALGLLIPNFLKGFYAVWMKFGGVAGAINTRIILILMFFLIFTPIGFLMRLFRDPLKLKRKSEDSSTYRETPDKVGMVARMNQPF